MNDGYLTTFADLLAEWKHDPSCSLKTSQDYSLQTVGKLWPELFMDWPASATTSDGGLFRQPRLGQPIDATDGGDLLGTPRTSTKNGASSIAVAKGEHRHRLEAQIAMLPTPTAHDAKDGPSLSRANRQTIDLGAIALLLPDASDASSSLANTAKPLSDGNVYWEEPHLILPTTDT